MCHSVKGRETGPGCRDGRCLWSILWWGNVKSEMAVGEGQEKALEFTVGRMNKPDVSTSNMPSMNITYKMPFVSTESYSYIYVYTEGRELKKVRRKNKELNSSALDFLSYL